MVGPSRIPLPSSSFTHKRTHILDQKYCYDKKRWQIYDNKNGKMFQQRPSFQCTVHIYFITFYLNYILIHLFAYSPTFHFSVSIIYFSFYSDVLFGLVWCVKFWRRSMGNTTNVELCVFCSLPHSKSVYVFYFTVCHIL